MTTAIEILDAFASADDQPMQDVKARIMAFVAEMERTHAPYCDVCMSCSTLKAVRMLLYADAGKEAGHA